MSKFLHDIAADDDDANAIAISRVFSENNQAIRRGLQARDYSQQKYSTYRLYFTVWDFSSNFFFFTLKVKHRQKMISNRDPVTPETTSAKSAFFNHVHF